MERSAGKRPFQIVDAVKMIRRHWYRDQQRLTVLHGDT